MVTFIFEKTIALGGEPKVIIRVMINVGHRVIRKAVPGTEMDQLVIFQVINTVCGPDPEIFVVVLREAEQLVFGRRD